MAKSTGPLFSLAASGKVGPRLTFSQRKTGQQVRFQRKNRDAKSVDQLEQRAIYSAALIAWRGLSANEKAVWNNLAVGKCLTGWNLFMQNYSMSVIQKVAVVYNVDLLNVDDTIFYTIPPGKKFFVTELLTVAKDIVGSPNYDGVVNLVRESDDEMIMEEIGFAVFMINGQYGTMGFGENPGLSVSAGDQILICVDEVDTGMTTAVADFYLIGFLVDA